MIFSCKKCSGKILEIAIKNTGKILEIVVKNTGKYCKFIFKMLWEPWGCTI
jgi:hypothetical protein